ncbi:MAG: hypothetical protein ACREAK_07150 [Nitrosarchaeum sp.]
MAFCSKCGNELSSTDADVCTHCGRLVNEQLKSIMNKSTTATEPDSKWWYLVPIFFSIIGGLIVYFALRKDSPNIAKNCLIIGIVMLVIGILVYLISFIAIIGSMMGTNL